MSEENKSKRDSVRLNMSDKGIIHTIAMAMIPTLIIGVIYQSVGISGDIKVLTEKMIRIEKNFDEIKEKTEDRYTKTEHIRFKNDVNEEIKELKSRIRALERSK